MKRERTSLVLAIPATAAALVAIIPIWYLLDRSFERGLDEVVDELSQDRTLQLVSRSLMLTVVVTVACVIIGTTAAWVVTRSDLPGRRVLRVLFALPLAVPSYLAAFAWISWKQDLAGFTGAALVLTLVSYPYVMLPVMDGFAATRAIRHDLGLSQLPIIAMTANAMARAARRVIFALCDARSMFVEPGFCCPDSQGHFFAFFDPSFVVALFGTWGKSSRSDLGLCDEAEWFRHSTDRF